MHLSVLVPTRNEAANVQPLVARVSAALAPLGIEWEMVFVDDSDDGTPARVREARGQGHPVRVLHRGAADRTGGLGGAVALGLRETAGSRVVAVMDGDLQHRPEVLVPLVDLVSTGQADIAIASRGTSLTSATGRIDRWWRSSVSRTSRALVQLLLPRLGSVNDPLAGFFALRREVIDEAELRPEGFKILLEVLVRGTWARVAEVPCELDARLHGRSKANLDQGVAFGRHLVRLVLAEARSRRRQSARPTQRTVQRELLGDHGQGRAGDEDAISAEDQGGAGRQAEVDRTLPRRLLARRHDLPEGLETMLAEQHADGDIGGEEGVDQLGTKDVGPERGLGVEQVAAAPAAPQQHGAREHAPDVGEPELGVVATCRAERLSKLDDLDLLAGVLLEDAAHRPVRRQQYPLKQAE